MIFISDLEIFAGVITAVAIACVYNRSPGFRYCFKYFVLAIGSSITGLIIVPCSLLRPRRAENAIFWAKILRPVSKLIGIHWEVAGKEILAKDVPFVAIMNHQCSLDFMLMVELWPTMRNCVSVAKRSLLYAFPFGLACWLSGTIFIDRANPKDCKVKLNAVAQCLQETKNKILIFPEGTYKKGENLLPFKIGAFNIAVQNKLPIIPIVVSPYSFINDEEKIFNSGKVFVRVLPPIDTSDVALDSIQEFAEKCREIMNNEFKKLKELVKNEAGAYAVHTFEPDTIREKKKN